MPDPKIESLLILQDRDQRRHDLERQLAEVPGEVAKLEKRIEEEKEKLDGAKKRIRELEVKRKDLENRVSTADQQIVRYKNQQLEVKKNEEYQALTHQIDQTRENMEKLEEEEIGVMLEIDEERERLTAIEKDFGAIIEGLAQKIDDWREREKGFRQDLERVKGEVEGAREKVDPAWLNMYDRQARIVRFPVVAAVVDRACRGCHLKVSGGIDDELRDSSKITTCDSCGRILYSGR